MEEREKTKKRKKSLNNIMKYTESLTHEQRNKLLDLFEILYNLNDEQRMFVISQFCHNCGINDPDCQCWNDD